jgi:hypothetical protein
MHFRRIALTTLVTVGLAAGLVACSSTAKHSAGTATPVTSAAVTTAAAVTTTPATTAAPPTAPPATTPPAETLPAHSLYDEVGLPDVPSGHTDPFVSSGVLADGAYWVMYNGGETLTPDITVLQAYFGAECESAAAAAGEECLDDVFVPDSPSRDIADLPFHDNVFLTVSDQSTQLSYWITPDELRTIRASSPSAGAPAGFGFTPFAFLMTVKDGEIWKFEQIWTP